MKTDSYEHLLPDKLSDLLEVAMIDLASVERMPETYSVEMRTWHNPVSDDTCEVCLAGAVIARSLRFDPSEHVHPGNFSYTTGDKLRAIDFLRQGELLHAWDTMNEERNLHAWDTMNEERDFPLEDRRVAPYRKDPALFKRDMASIIRDLRELGL